MQHLVAVVVVVFTIHRLFLPNAIISGTPSVHPDSPSEGDAKCVVTDCSTDEPKRNSRKFTDESKRNVSVPGTNKHSNTQVKEETRKTTPGTRDRKSRRSPGKSHEQTNNNADRRNKSNPLSLGCPLSRVPRRCCRGCCIATNTKKKRTETQIERTEERKKKREKQGQATTN